MWEGKIDIYQLHDIELDYVHHTYMDIWNNNHSKIKIMGLNVQ